MFVCSRCGAKLRLRDKYCSVCGLRRKGGKGRIPPKEEKGKLEGIGLKKQNQNIFDKVKNHRILFYYDADTLSKEMLNSEPIRIQKRIDEISDKILKTPSRGLPEYLYREQRSLESQLETIYHYVFLKNMIKMTEKLSKCYDTETLTLNKIRQDIDRLIKKIREVEDTLVYMEQSEPSHPEKMEFYKKRDKIRDQLDMLHDYNSLLNREKFWEFKKDSKLESIYGKLPDWRIEEKKGRK